MNISPLRCPVCAESLQLHSPNQNLSCIHQHQFDRARQGYWNLLLVQQKNSKTPGDNKAMISARQEFLNQGHYSPIAKAVVDTIQTRVRELREPDNSPISDLQLLDIGCGEGYYSCYMAEKLNAGCYDFTGIDISKEGIRKAAQRDKKLTWLVASAAHMPLKSASIDIATLLFGRLFPTELTRVLKPNGLFLWVGPGAKHLLELRQLIYPSVKTTLFDPTEQLQPHFRLSSTQSLSFKITLEDNMTLRNLLHMTPHGQHLDTKAREKISMLEHTELSVDVRILVFQKIP